VHTRSNKKKLVALFILLGVGVAVLFITDLILGSVHIPLQEVLNGLLHKEVSKVSWRLILYDFRLPKAITALIAGSGLAVSGLLMQTLFRNPLAGPFVLGISNGSSLGVALLVMANGVFFGNSYAESSWSIISASVIGSLFVMLLVFLTSMRIADNASLLIVGMMFGSLTGAVVVILQYFSSPELIKSYLVWTFGSLAGVSWNQLKVMLPVSLIGLLIAFSTTKALNALLLGEHYAKGLGISVGFARILVMLATSILAGTVTAFCGPIAFIGLAVPHLCRTLFNTSDHKLLIPSVVLMGAGVMLFCDILAQMPGSQSTLPINAVTALIGSPVVIAVIMKSKNPKSAF
jgi:iron complex transport system permease protein